MLCTHGDILTITVHSHPQINRSSSIQVREDNSYFIRIERTDFRRILLSVESTNIKVVEHGKEVLLLEKASLGKYLVVKGTAEKMLDHILQSEIGTGSQEGQSYKMLWRHADNFAVISRGVYPE